MGAKPGQITATLDEMKQNPAGVLARSSGATVILLDQDKPSAYLVPAEIYEALLDRMDDLELAEIVRVRESEKKQSIPVTLNDL